MKKPSKRTLILGGAALLIILLLALAFRSPPVLVDSTVVVRDHFQVTVEEEGRTRVKDRYQIFSPVTGYMSRIHLLPGDEVKRGQALVSIQATALDPRSRAQAEANLARAEAALESARSQVEAAEARAELAETELKRTAPLVEQGHMSQEALDRARTESRQAEAALRSARFAVDVARHERENARAALSAGGEGEGTAFTVTSPIEGLVLNRTRESAGAVQMGEALLTLGDIASLEVEVDLLSPDAVRVRPGMRVELERWGGDEALPGRVQRVEPAGFLYYSALGVEEQRVWVIVDFTSNREEWQALGDQYRVEARFILWEGENVLQVPASALFREGDDWATYVVADGKAVRRSVVPGRRSGLLVEVKDGLEPGETVVLHPGEDIGEGTRVELR